MNGAFGDVFFGHGGLLQIRIRHLRRAWYKVYGTPVITDVIQTTAPPVLFIAGFVDHEALCVAVSLLVCVLATERHGTPTTVATRPAVRMIQSVQSELPRLVPQCA
jgi:hypothetical protein